MTFICLHRNQIFLTPDTVKTKIMPSLRLIVLTGVALLPLVAVPNRARAAFVLTLTQSGGDVLVSGTGTINTTALTQTINNSGFNPRIQPSQAVLIAGPLGTTGVDGYSSGGFTGPSAFGTGTSTILASSGTGSIAGLLGYNEVIVPHGYTSGTMLTDSATFTGQTFASLGFTPGTYTYTWGTGLNADSLTVTSGVPEPATWVAGSMCCILLLGVAFRRRPA